MIAPRPSTEPRHASVIAGALAESREVWMLDCGDDSAPSLHLGSEATVRNDVLDFIGEDVWPAGWRLRRVEVRP